MWNRCVPNMDITNVVLAPSHKRIAIYNISELELIPP